MLKKVSLVSFILALLLLFPLLGSCSKKTPLTETEFSDLATQAGYTVTNPAEGSPFEPSQNVTASVQAYDPDGKIPIEFYAFSSADTAHDAGVEVYNTLKSMSGGWVLRVTNTNSYWRGTNNSTFYFYALVDNTIIYAETADTNKDALSKILKTLGYW